MATYFIKIPEPPMARPEPQFAMLPRKNFSEQFLKDRARFMSMKPLDFLQWMRSNVFVSSHQHKPYKLFHEVVQWHARLAMNNYGLSEPLNGPLEMAVVFWRRCPGKYARPAGAEALPAQRPDGSNYLKALEDALNGLWYCDDAQIVQSLPFKRYTIGDQRIEIMLRTLDEKDAVSPWEAHSYLKEFGAAEFFNSEEGLLNEARWRSGGGAK